MTSARPPIDLEAHAIAAAERYRATRGLYQDTATTIQAILRQALAEAGVTVASIEARAKSMESFEAKAALPAPEDPTTPKYPDPLTEITDLAAARVITFFPRAIGHAEEVIQREFDVHERADKGDILAEPERFGYKSVHYVVGIPRRRTDLPEYARFRNLRAEIQVRTILQHAWAEIEHDIQYKSEATIPDAIRRRFMAIAGLLEIADREFQAIQEEDERDRQAARREVHEGNLEAVSITPDSLRTYLDQRLGPDGRMSTPSYDWTAGLLLKLGFTNLAQVEEAIRPYDDDRLSRIAYGSRLGQLTRFELQLLAAGAEAFIARHTWAEFDWFRSAAGLRLAELRKAGISVGGFHFPEFPPAAT